MVYRVVLWSREVLWSIGRCGGFGRCGGIGRCGSLRWCGSCTDGNTVFRCDSDKNSLVIIYMF